MQKIIIKVKFRRFIARYFYYPVKLLYNLRMSFENFNNAPVIIITRGKVGSSSVYYSLKKQLSNLVFHIHYLSKNTIEKQKQLHINSDRKSVPFHLIVSEYLIKRLKQYKGMLYIITIIREPISREISDFMENINFFKNSIERNNLSIDNENTLIILNQSLENNVRDYIENWHKEEIESNFNIDVFSKPFNHKKQYMIFRKGQYNLLLMKVETMDEIFSKAINELLSKFNYFYLEKSNIGENKYYASDYKKLKRSLKIDNKLIQYIANSRYMKHFYSKDEISDLPNKLT